MQLQRVGLPSLFPPAKQGRRYHFSVERLWLGSTTASLFPNFTSERKPLAKQSDTSGASMETNLRKLG